MTEGQPPEPGQQLFGARGALGEESLRRMASDARSLLTMARGGEFAVDPDSANAIAKAYEDMVDDIFWVKVGLLTAGQHPRLGTSPYATRVSDYQHGAALAFKEAVLELEDICRRCAEAYREAARHYVAMDDDAAARINRDGVP